MIGYTKAIFTIAGVASLSLSVPQQAEKGVSFRQARSFSALTVKVDRQHPPLAALEDLSWMEANEKNSGDKTDSGIQLQPTEKKAPRVIDLEETKVSRLEILESSDAEPNKIVWKDSQPGSIPSDLEKYISESATSSGSYRVVSFDRPLRVDRTTIQHQSPLTPGPKGPGVFFADATLPPHGEKKVKKPEASTASVSTDEPFLLKGRLLLTDGAAYYGPQTTVKVFRFDDGRVREFGSVNLKSGSFSINIPKKDGVLRGEVLGSFGEVLAHGELWVPDLKQNTETVLKIAAVEQPLKGKIVSQYGARLAAQGAQITGVEGPLPIEKDDTFKTAMFSDASTFLFRGEALDHWPLLSFGSSANPVALNLFPESKIKALFELARDHFSVSPRRLMERGIVWGVAKAGGQPVGGAEVSLANLGAVGPVYFNESFIPDFRLTKTSSSGLFAFLDVDAGLGAVHGVKDGRSLGTITLPGAFGHITQISLDAGNGQGSEFVLSEGISADPRPAEVGFFGGTKRAIFKKGYGEITLSSGSDPVVLEARPFDSTYSFLLTSARNTRILAFKTLKDKTIDRLIAASGRQQYPDRGVVIGWGNTDNYQVFLDESDEDSELVFFDRTGERVNRAQAGGGFFITNVPVGYRSLTVNETSGRVTTQVVPALAGVVSTTNALF